MAKLIVREGGEAREIALGGRVTIGRQPDNEVVLADASSSRRHAAIVPENGRYALQDLGSANGTRVNGARVSHHLLAIGDVVQIGDASLLFSEDAPQADPAYAATAMAMPAFVPGALAYPAPAEPAAPIPAAIAAPAARPQRAPVAAPHPSAHPAPEPEPQALAYAGFWRRVAAVLIDGILLGVPFFVLQRAALGLLGGIEPQVLALGFGLLQMTVTLLYFARWESSAKGATFGKRLLGIRVVDESGGRVGFGRALARNLAKVLSGAICGFGYLFAAFTLRKCAWHDSLAGCLVVKDLGSSMAVPSAGGACRGCGAGSRPGLTYCTQCGRRLR